MSSNNRDEASIWTDPNATRWDVFIAGYLAGITHGIGMGRAEVAQECADAETFPHDRASPTPSHESVLFACEGLSRAEWLDRQRAERAERTAHQYPSPALNPEQIRENAYRSWGLTDPQTVRWEAA